MMVRNRWFLGIGIFSFALATAAVAVDVGDGKRTTIGVIAPLTGEGATYGASMQKGISLALSDAKGTRLVFEDSRFQAKEAVAAFKKLIAFDKVDAIYGEAAHQA